MLYDQCLTLPAAALAGAGSRGGQGAGPLRGTDDVPECKYRARHATRKRHGVAHASELACRPPGSPAVHYPKYVAEGPRRTHRSITHRSVVARRTPLHKSRPEKAIRRATRYIANQPGACTVGARRSQRHACDTEYVTYAGNRGMFWRRSVCWSAAKHGRQTTHQSGNTERDTQREKGTVSRTLARCLPCNALRCRAIPTADLQVNTQLFARHAPHVPA